ncbi:DUF3000 domain-containing protein [Luteococcus sp. Sow4_B9]|uniref:DUF3000 domain-containing protein n=1 Tax=Luteococcus sp. Sow4_B9 TaxID=3438792 RepID=UPI003F97614C
MSAELPPDADADVFAELVDRLDQQVWRHEVTVERIPSPQRIAPHAVAVEAEVDQDGAELGSGRLVLLYDPAGVEAWEGTHRCVTLARAEVDLEMVTDPLLAEVGWSWLTDALHRQGARYCAASGTVTAVSSRCFGAMEDEPERAEVEIRASWTPLLDGPDDLARHLAAWEHLLCTTAGLPDLPPGIVRLAARTGGGRRGPSL